MNKVIKEGDKVVGVEYSYNGQNVSDLSEAEKNQAELLQHVEHGTVVLATGGYAADFTSDSLLQKHRPEYYNLVSLALRTRRGC